ncbi:hypothetical protein AAFF_G00406380 [Aldrovandia affinis]|uniref:C2H2-type domain-containing protein n=1 Tax=Aldrovandia affinis TaxID=143900 RepID=A0AAD7SCN4_9TELE|nr:hypothetical protein AAFF_G00406380 [Aldrovandia affinis]
MHRVGVTVGERVMSGSTVTRWVISDDGNQLIRREEVEAAFPKGAVQESLTVQVKEENSDQPVTNVSSSASSSLSTNKRNATPTQLPVSYPCSYCDICFTASHYLEKHVKRSHRKQYLEMLRSPSDPSSSQAAPLPSPKTIPSPTKVKSAPASQSQVAQASECSTGPTVGSITPEMPEKDPAPVPPTSNSIKPSASVPSSGQAEMAVKPIPKEASTPAPPQPPCLPSEAKEVKKEAQSNLPSPCAHCGGRREGESEGEGEKECCCEEGTLFLCNECGQSFPSFPSLNSHQDQVHWCKVEGRGEDEGETLYLCAECGLSFPCLDLLHHHQSLHDSPGSKDGEEGTEEEEKDDDDDSTPSDSQAHSCPHCQKTFKTARYLKTHMKIHSGQCEDGGHREVERVKRPHKRGDLNLQAWIHSQLTYLGARLPASIPIQDRYEEEEDTHTIPQNHYAHLGQDNKLGIFIAAAVGTMTLMGVVYCIYSQFYSKKPYSHTQLDDDTELILDLPESSSSYFSGYATTMDGQKGACQAGYGYGSISDPPSIINIPPVPQSSPPLAAPFPPFSLSTCSPLQTISAQDLEKSFV